MDVYVALLGAVLLPNLALSFKGGCLTGRGQKSVPSQETTMKECHLYSKASCCSANFTEELVPPVTKVYNTNWDVCGKLSDRCEAFMIQLECFYQCSPQAAHWMNPHYTAGFLNAPICVNYCDSWYDACKDDLTCARNWLADFKWDSDGNHCQQECVPYSKMYKDGTDMCQSMWGASFSPSSSKGRCLQMDDQDEAVVSQILCPSSKSDTSDREERCHKSSLNLDEISPNQKVSDSLLASCLFALAEYFAYLSS